MSNFRGFTINDKDDLKVWLENRKIVDKETGCWLWTEGILEGYGYMYIKGRQLKVHRMYLYVCGKLDINDNKVRALHKPECPNKRCFNPDHLYVGTDADNVRDTSNKIQSNPLYPCGHPRESWNTDSQKSCKWCHRLTGNKKRHYEDNPNPTGPRNWKK